MCDHEEYMRELNRKVFLQNQPAELLPVIEQHGIDPLSYDIIDRCMPDIIDLTPIERLEFFENLSPDLARAYQFWESRA